MWHGNHHGDEQHPNLRQLVLDERWLLPELLDARHILVGHYGERLVGLDVHLHPLCVPVQRHHQHNVVSKRRLLEVNCSSECGRGSRRRHRLSHGHGGMCLDGGEQRLVDYGHLRRECSGNGTVEYSVAANTGAPRTGTVTIATKTFTVNQGAEGCYYSINPTGAGVPPAGGSGSVAVTAATGCAWTAVSNDAFITVTSGASGSGDGSVGYSVACRPGSDVPARSRLRA